MKKPTGASRAERSWYALSYSGRVVSAPKGQPKSNPARRGMEPTEKRTMTGQEGPEKPPKCRLQVLREVTKLVDYLPERHENLLERHRTL
jgi:hypothetical protein